MFNKFIILGTLITILVVIVLLGFLIQRQTSKSTPEEVVTIQKTEEYQVTVPENWIFEPGSIFGGQGSFNTLTPTTDLPEKPRIIIQGTDPSVASLQSVEDGLKDFQYKSMPIVVDGINTTAYFGVIPPSETRPISKRTISFALQKEDTVYLFEFSYQSDSPRADLEEVFTDFYSQVQLSHPTQQQ